MHVTSSSTGRIFRRACELNAAIAPSTQSLMHICEIANRKPDSWGRAVGAATAAAGLLCG